MIHAYDERYLDDAMRNLGEAADYAANACKMNLQKFFDLFVVTGFATQFGNGVPKIISGLSGTELVHEIIVKSRIEQELPEVQTAYDCSPEYWCGWIIAYYQWNTGRTFKDIFKNISAKEIEKLYPTLHEAAEEKFVDVVNAIIERKTKTTKLQELRKNIGYSQRELAEKSEVNLRTLQQYELKAKDINKAATSTLLALSKTLGCKIEDLLENV
ncbi:MAG: helix-turn-helix transcriptional regulator [Oscillospiraceae bacterium]|nr:helix-turn-helix transcriptional regulator [Oscillospiraceae bacterium]